MDTINLGIVCPMGNEAPTAESFVKETLAVTRAHGFKSIKFFTILDDVCKDGTMDILREQARDTPELNVVYAPDNRCIADAYLRGYSEALRAGCDWILEIDAGFSHNPANIPLFLEKMKDGYDCVFGSRFCEGGSITNSSRVRYLISWGGSLLTNLLLRTRLSDLTSGFELFKHSALQSIVDRGIRSKGPFFQTEIKIYAHPFNIVEVPIQYEAASHSVGGKGIAEALFNLFYLFRLRVMKRL
ncbi:MAG: glycosyltransferase [Gammaproteobacteria bacterium]|nr:glycosyltransferase [Gammaproteobacteria bacterium]MDH3466129.1 glycosyltransferase [Gammaproteobacteria bacterium]